MNEVGAANNLPLEFVDGYIRQVRVSIPWSALLTASSYVEIGGLMLTVQAKQMQDDGESAGDVLMMVWWTGHTGRLPLSRRGIQVM